MSEDTTALKIEINSIKARLSKVEESAADSAEIKAEVKYIRRDIDKLLASNTWLIRAFGGAVVAAVAGFILQGGLSFGP